MSDEIKQPDQDERPAEESPPSEGSTGEETSSEIAPEDLTQGDLSPGDSTPGPPPELAAEAELHPQLKMALIEVERLRVLVEEDRAKPKKQKKKKADGLGTSRGIETMFKTSYRTHINLSALADNKAGIMISINGFIISIMLASAPSTVGLEKLLLIPATVLLLGCVAAMVFAVLAARPRVSATAVTLQDIKDNTANILFFGNFVTMTEPEYVEGMRDLIMDTDRLYTNMIRDIYGLGGVLAKKFRLLRISYNVFMATLVVGVPLFIGFFAWTALPNS